MADLLVHGGASVDLLRPVSLAGTAWVDEHISDDTIKFRRVVVVEHRCVGDLAIARITGGSGS